MQVQPLVAVKLPLSVSVSSVAEPSMTAAILFWVADGQALNYLQLLRACAFGDGTGFFHFIKRALGQLGFSQVANGGVT